MQSSRRETVTADLMGEDLTLDELENIEILYVISVQNGYRAGGKLYASNPILNETLLKLFNQFQKNLVDAKRKPFKFSFLLNEGDPACRPLKRIIDEADVKQALIDFKPADTLNPQELAKALATHLNKTFAHLTLQDEKAFSRECEDHIAVQKRKKDSYFNSQFILQYNYIHWSDIQKREGFQDSYLKKQEEYEKNSVYKEKIKIKRKEFLDRMHKKNIFSDFKRKAIAAKPFLAKCDFDFYETWTADDFILKEITLFNIVMNAILFYTLKPLDALFFDEFKENPTIKARAIQFNKKIYKTQAHTILKTGGEDSPEQASPPDSKNFASSSTLVQPGAFFYTRSAPMDIPSRKVNTSFLKQPPITQSDNPVSPRENTFLKTYSRFQGSPDSPTKKRLQEQMAELEREMLKQLEIEMATLLPEVEDQDQNVKKTEETTIESSLSSSVQRPRSPF